MEFLQSIVGKVVMGVVALGVIGGGIALWQAGPEGREAFFDASGKIVGWVLIVALLPWATFWLVTKVARMDSNAAGGALVAGLTVVELAVLWWMFGFGTSGPTVAWVFAGVGALLAAAYNLLACDWIADRLVG